MMKSKPFYGAEFRIKRLAFDKDGLAYFVLETAEGHEFESVPEGKDRFRTNTDYRRYIGAHPELFIDKKATARYYDLSKDKIPLNATVSAVRDYE